MSLKKIYNCDVCRTDKKIDELLAVNFSGMSKFVLVEATALRSHEGVHLCKSCCVQIQESDKPKVI